jgi:hypothetical protein
MTDAAYEAFAAGVRGRKHARSWQLFIGLLVLASALPFIVMPLVQHGMADPGKQLQILGALTFVGANFHVAASAWFYTDRSLYSHFRANKTRYLVIPAILIATSAAYFQFAPPLLRGVALAGFFSWQLWHYQKQNVGLLSFVAAGTDGVAVSVWERRTLMVAAVAGIAGYFSLNAIGLRQYDSAFQLLHRAGGALYLAVPVLFGIALATCPSLRHNPLRLVCLSFGALFFLPTFLFSDWISATLGYSVAHGLQYLVFMGFVVVGRPKPGPSLALMVGMATLGAIVLNAAILAPSDSSLGYGYALYGAFVGVTMSHFVLDAGLWRLREPFQRRYMREKFHFVFDR